MCQGHVVSDCSSTKKLVCSWNAQGDMAATQEACARDLCQATGCGGAPSSLLEPAVQLKTYSMYRYSCYGHYSMPRWPASLSYDSSPNRISGHGYPRPRHCVRAVHPRRPCSLPSPRFSRKCLIYFSYVTTRKFGNMLYGSTPRLIIIVYEHCIIIISVFVFLRADALTASSSQHMLVLCDDRSFTAATYYHCQQSQHHQCR